MNAFYKDISALLAGDFSPGTRRIVINAAVWCATEGDGRKSKYIGCRFWSRGAIADVQANGFGGLSKRLRHEHVVPRALVVDEVVRLKSPTPEDVRRVFDTYALGCVVTVEEMSRLDRSFRKSMPDGWNAPGRPGGPDVWARYAAARVQPIGPLMWRGKSAWVDGAGSPVIVTT